MNERKSPGTQFSVMLTVDSRGYSPSTVELAVAMAAAMESQLHGLFIEDEDLLRLAALPCSRDICFTTAQARSSDATSMERSLRAMSAQFRQYLARHADAARVPYTYDSMRGRSRDVDLQVLPGIEYQIFGLSTAHYLRPRRLNCRILLIADHSPRLSNALQLILRWEASPSVTITVVQPEADPGAPGDGQLADILRTTMQATVIEKPRQELSRLLDRNQARFDYVIASRAETAGTLRSIISSVGCPVILVS